MFALIIAYIATAVAMAVLDAIWLTIMANIVYRPVIGDMMLDGFRVGPAVVFYLLYVVGAVYFAVRPALAAGAWSTALLNGALFGFFAYMTYDLTNQATLRNWSTTLSATDIAWGTLLTAVAATAGYAAAARFGGA
jgi:uncharacterized membrane protein